VDDDDTFYDENIQHIISAIHNDDNIDVIAHSLKLEYTDNIREDLVTNIVSFKEKQEVFNYLFKRDLISTTFSDGIHEDIRYVTEILLASANIQILNSKIYNKIQRNDSITKELSTYRIDGYLSAITEIVNIDNPIIDELKNEIVTQCLGVILYLINNSNNDSKLQFINHLENTFPIELRKLITKRYNKNNTNFKYAVSLFLNSRDTNQLISDLD
jgi:hypothetical protein